MYKNILVPLDGSKLSEEKIPIAMNLAKIFSAKITLIRIAEIIPLLKEAREAESKGLLDEAEKYLNQIRGTLEKEGISVNVVAKTGKPEVEVLRYAKRKDVDLIIMSTHGLGGFGRWALGSVSEKVVRHSPKPVLLLRSSSRDLLRGKTILAVDDEPDVLEVLAEQLDLCVIHKATNHEMALEYLQKYKYDIVILDIMGVNGFDLLKQTVMKGIPTVVLTAHALTPEALRKSMEGGAVFYLPKDKIGEIEELLVDVIKAGGKPIWSKILERFGSYFHKRFGWGDKDEEDLKKELEEIFLNRSS